MITAVHRFKWVAASAATFLFMAGTQVHAQQRTGLVVDQQTVEGQVRTKPEQFIAEAGIRVGDTITINDVQIAIRRLWSTGKYKTIEPRLAEQPEQTHVALHWLIEEQPFINRIEFHGLENIKESKVLEESKLKGAGPYRPGRVAARLSGVAATRSG